MKQPLLVIAIVLLPIETAYLLAVDTDSKPTLDEVRAAWKNRQQMVRSAQIRWSGSVTRTMWGDQEVSAKRVHKLTLEKQLVRLTSEGKRAPQLSNGQVVWKHQKTTDLYLADSELSHSLFREPVLHIDPSVGPSNGFLFKARTGPTRNHHVDPILMHFRALSPKLTNIEGNLSVTERTGLVEGRRCSIVWEDGQRKTEYWVDPQRDFAIVRMREFSQPGRCVADTTICYEADPRVKWIPKSWHGTYFLGKTGGVHKSCKYEVTSISINPQIEPSEFEYQFPPGTRVVDYRDSPPTQYIVREKGEKRIITRAESAANYFDLMRTESGKASPKGGTK